MHSNTVCRPDHGVAEIPEVLSAKELVLGSQHPYRVLNAMHHDVGTGLRNQLQVVCLV
jgi:hypothetical protein